MSGSTTFEKRRPQGRQSPKLPQTIAQASLVQTSPGVLQASEAIGDIIEFWGFKRVLGRIWTLLHRHDITSRLGGDNERLQAEVCLDSRPVLIDDAIETSPRRSNE